MASFEISVTLTMLRVGITGANGQLGSELKLQFELAGYQVVAFTRQMLDISNLEEVARSLRDIGLDFLINCAAFTNVDAAEQDALLAFKVNADGPRNLAITCKAEGIRFIHISTDSVFSSDSPHYFRVDNPTNPLNVYSKSKDAGEQGVTATYPEGSWIVRTAWIYGGFGGRFVHAIIKKSKESGNLKVVEDQFGQPTTTRALARFLNTLITSEANPGTYHFASQNYASRFNFARSIFEFLGEDIDRIQPSTTLPINQVAVRPRYSLLQLNNQVGNTIVELDNWEKYLADFLANMGR